jgi:hypothetical protein
LARGHRGVHYLIGQSGIDAARGDGQHLAWRADAPDEAILGAS